jgi:hypothetical protein
MSVLRMRLLQTKVITLKTQLHAVNACVKRLSQLSFRFQIIIAGINLVTFDIFSCFTNGLAFSTDNQGSIKDLLAMGEGIEMGDSDDENSSSDDDGKKEAQVKIALLP